MNAPRRTHFAFHAAALCGQRYPDTAGYRTGRANEVTCVSCISNAKRQARFEHLGNPDFIGTRFAAFRWMQSQAVSNQPEVR